MATDTIRKKFASQLCGALTRRYKRIPSATFVAIQFNRRFSQHNGITGETARRWMRGQSMPDYGHLQILVQWLQLNIAALFDIDTSLGAPPRCISSAQPPDRRLSV